MQLILLGTGTSTGVPEVACSCAVCQSPDPRDKRLRTSALLVTSRGKRILIDCGPDFRQQANYIGLDRVDAVLLTHEHYDHVYGLDDLRTLAHRQTLPIYAQEQVLEAVRSRMHYAFGDNPYPGTPRMELRQLSLDEPLHIAGVEVQPILVMHGKLPIYGFRFRDPLEDEASIVYITDMKSIAPREWAKVEGAQLMIINALRHKKEHPSHQSLLDVRARIEAMSHPPKLTVLTHLSHHAPCYADLESLLPLHIRSGYDYMCLSVQEGRVQAQDFVPSASPYDYVDLDRSGLRLESFEAFPWAMHTPNVGVSRLAFVSSVDECVFGFALWLDPRQYACNRSEVVQAVGRVLSDVAGLYHLTMSQLDRCVSLNAEEVYPLRLSIRVNGLRDSLQVLSNSSQEIDMTVLKAQISAATYAIFKSLMAPQFKTSILDA